MNIGLVRHFKVDCEAKPWMTSADFSRWAKEYDERNVIEKAFHQSIKWDYCYASDLQRAMETSKYIFNGKIISTELLREVPLAPAFETRLRLPHLFWCISGRVAWFFQHRSQQEKRKWTRQRIHQFMDCLPDEPDSNIMIVSHGFIMRVMQFELKRRGFHGPFILNPENGALYLFKRGGYQ